MVFYIYFCNFIRKMSKRKKEDDTCLRKKTKKKSAVNSFFVFFVYKQIGQLLQIEA